MILIGSLNVQWIDGVDENGNILQIPNSVAGAAIFAAANAFVPLTLMVIAIDPEPKALPFPAYSFNKITKVLTIDIDEIKAGHIMEIALPSGVITVKSSK